MERPSLADHALPWECPEEMDDPARPWRRGVITAELLRHVVSTLERSQASAVEDPALAITDQELYEAWQRTLVELRDPGSSPRRQIDPWLTEVYGTSPPALQAALESMVDGVMGNHARTIFEAARGRRNGSPLLVVLAANIPALAVQALLPALALRRPVLLKSPSAEPLWTPLLVDRLVIHEPRLRSLVAAVTWPGGAEDLERVVLPKMGRVLAYGDATTMADLDRRAGSRLIGLGPKLSLAIVGGDVDPQVVCEGLATDIALFEQRGCLSVQAVFTLGDPRALADHLASSLRSVAGRWPVKTLGVAPSVRQLRDEATMRGLYQPSLDLSQGTVIVEEPVLQHGGALQATFQPSPGGRCVRIYPVDSQRSVLDVLAPWKGQLQGAALAGRGWELEPSLLELGISRCAVPGELQHPDSSWRNGGVSLLEALATDPSDDGKRQSM